MNTSEEAGLVYMFDVSYESSDKSDVNKNFRKKIFDVMSHYNDTCTWQASDYYVVNQSMMVRNAFKCTNKSVLTRIVGDLKTLSNILITCLYVMESGKTKNIYMYDAPKVTSSTDCYIKLYEICEKSNHNKSLPNF